MTPSSIDAAALAACERAGLEYRSVPMDGAWHTLATADGSSQTDGRIRLFPDGRGGLIQNWRSDEAPQPFFVDDAPLSDDERRRRDAERAEATAKAEAARERKAARAAETAARVWEAAGPVADTQYLVRKGVQGTVTLRQIDAETAARVLGYLPKGADGEALEGLLLVAGVTVGGRLSSVELIDGPGRKHALAGGRRAGGFWATGLLPDNEEALPGNTVLLGEGVATCLSAAEATGCLAVAAFSNGNLGAVARMLRDRYPTTTIAVLADLNKRTGEPDTKAQAAARAVPGCVLVVPAFGPGREPGWTDFNDLHAARGLDAVRACILGCLEADRQTAPAPVEDAETEPPPEGAAEAPKGWSLTSNMVFEIKPAKDGKDEYIPVCGPLRVLGRTTGPHGEWGLMLEFLDHDRRKQRRAIPAARLHEDPSILACELETAGLKIIPGKAKRMLAYLAGWQVAARILSAKRLGWLEDPTGALAFVMPDRVIARGGSTEVVYQPERFSPTVRTVHAAGSLEDWKANIAALACAHRWMLFALCAGFAPPFLAFTSASDSFIVHPWGTTSRGKTTLGQLAASPWGCAADPNDAPSLSFVRRWNVTGNGLEGLAEAHSDMPLVLDELGAATVGDVRPLVYQLSGGQGKTALNSARELKEPRSWRTIAFSTGELSLHARMSDADGTGTRQRPIKGGLTHRALDLEIGDIVRESPADKREGIVSTIKAACARHYGTAGPALIQSMVDRFGNGAEARAYVKRGIDAFMADGWAGGAPETMRALRRFGMIAAAGEFAAQAGLLPLTEEKIRGELRAVALSWLGGSMGTDEDRIVDAVRGFVMAHAARFQRVRDEKPPPQRAGYVSNGCFCFSKAALVEAAPGNDATTIARALRKAGLLFTNDSKLLANITTPQGRARLYAVEQRILEESEGRSFGGGQGGQGGQGQQPQGFEPVHLRHPPGGQGGQGHGAADDAAAARPPCPPAAEVGGRPETRATIGDVHLVHLVHPKKDEGDLGDGFGPW